MLVGCIPTIMQFKIKILIYSAEAIGTHSHFLLNLKKNGSCPLRIRSFGCVDPLVFDMKSTSWRAIPHAGLLIEETVANPPRDLIQPEFTLTFLPLGHTHQPKAGLPPQKNLINHGSTRIYTDLFCCNPLDPWLKRFAF